jgi:hypothetical protein
MVPEAARLFDVVHDLGESAFVRLFHLLVDQGSGVETGEPAAAGIYARP